MDSAGPIGMKTAIVLSGGGSLGSVQAGMLAALDSAGVVPDLIVGTSAGALNAAYVARRRWPGGTDRLDQVWTTLRRADVFPLSIAAAARAARGLSDHAVPSTGLARLVRQHLPYRRLEDAPVELAVVTTDALTGREVVLRAGPAVEAVLASAALPGVFPPVLIDGHHLIDGGLVDHTPVSVAARMGADRIYDLPSGYACALSSSPKTAFGMALHAFSIAIHGRLADDINALQDDVQILVAPPLCPLRVPPTDFSQAAPLIDRARASTAAWLLEPQPEDQTAHLGLHHHSNPRAESAHG